MAEGNEGGGVFGGHDASEAGGAENVPFGGVACGDRLQGFGFHADLAHGDRFAHGAGFLGNIHHAGGAGGIQMG